MHKILLVEDDRTLNAGISYALKKEGYAVCQSFSREEALTQLNEYPDLILLDVNLPDGDGRDFLRELRRSNPMPVILLTARDTEADMLKGFDAGCDDYIAKPFSFPLLLRRIKALLKRSNGMHS